MSDTERIVNIVWTKEESEKEGFCTNSVFRVLSEDHEQFLLEGSEFIVDATAAEATPLTCPLNYSDYEHGCYSAGY